MDISEYEQIRLKNIELNKKFLEDIGLSSGNYDKTINKKRRIDNASAIKNRKVAITDVEPRRSTRVALMEPVRYHEPKVVVANTIHQTVVEKGILEFKENSQNKNVADSDYLLSLSSVSHTDSMMCSCSTIDCNYSQFLNQRLCKPIDEYGKAAIMTLSNNGKEPKFNKYPGVIEWKNCLYLWVNIGGASGYKNAFSHGGKYITWFGGSKMKAESNLTKRLLKAGKIEEINSKSSFKATTTSVNNSNSAEDILLLFVRTEGGNYCSLGRLKIAEYNIIDFPIQIKWELLDFEQFNDSKEFKHILDECR